MSLEKGFELLEMMDKFELCKDILLHDFIKRLSEVG